MTDEHIKRIKSSEVPDHLNQEIDALTNRVLSTAFFNDNGEMYPPSIVFNAISRLAAVFIADFISIEYQEEIFKEFMQAVVHNLRVHLEKEDNPSG